MRKSPRQLQQESIQRSTLAAKTLLYWQISIAKNLGRGPLAGGSTEYAVGLAADLESSTSWESHLGQQSTALLNSLIGRPTRRKTGDKRTQRRSKPPRSFDDDDGPQAA